MEGRTEAHPLLWSLEVVKLAGAEWATAGALGCASLYLKFPLWKANAWMVFTLFAHDLRPFPLAAVVLGACRTDLVLREGVGSFVIGEVSDIY